MVYGKRRLVLALLIGFLLGYLSRSENMITAGLGTTDFIVIGKKGSKINNYFCCDDCSFGIGLG
jgi:hypothetical protein